MDNVTHTLVGLAVGEALCQLRRRPLSASFRAQAWTVSAVGNNLPDLDLVYTRITAGPLGYLLHHRGHTHTLLLALVQSALLFAAARFFLRRRKLSVSRAELRDLGALALLGPILHIAFDGLNSYGVHPFWPVDSHWYYGDSLFIIEPMLWLTLTIPLAVGVGRFGKAMLGAIALAAVLLGWFIPTIPTYSAVLLTGLALVLLALSLTLTPKARAALALASTIVVLLVFVFTGSHVRDRILRETKEGRMTDVVLTPVPANPLCWVALAVGVDGNEYFVRKGMLSLWPSFLPAAQCRTFRPESGSVPLRSIPSPNSGTEWLGEYRGNLETFQSTKQSRCDFAAFLRFARVPYVGEADAGDLRFDFRSGGNFARIALPPSPRCPAFVPPWIPPANFR